MNLEYFAQRIGLSKDACDVIKKYNISDEEARLALKQIELDTEGFLKSKQSSEIGAYYEYMLALYVKIALLRHQDYVDNNWGDDVYFDTFKDFAIWNDVCVKETGICGLKELNWLAEPIQLKIFRLGRLQFQPTITEEDYTYNDILIPKGSKAYNIHIPAGEPLNENACTQSYDSATTFFSSESIICLCSSWLLSPVLDELLPSSSNILRFKSRYKIISVNPENRSAERYLFGSIEDDIQKYKPTSSFAAKVKQRLEKGMPIGSAFGIYLHRSR